MARKLRVVRNPGGLEYGQWIPAQAVRFNENGSVSMDVPGRAVNRGRRTNRRRRNIAAGFWDDSGFHPIRASYDYSPSRAGETRKPKRKAKAKKRRKAKAKARRR